MHMKKVRVFTAVFYLVLLGLSFIPYAQSSDPADHVIITEVLYDPPGKDVDEEWIELYNPTDIAVNLDSWTLQDDTGTYTFPYVNILSKSYLVVVKNVFEFVSRYNTTPDLDGLHLYLGDSGDQLILSDNNSVEVDFVAWEWYVAGWEVSAEWSTIRRINATDTDSTSDWEDSGSLGDPGDGSYAIIIPEFPVVGITLLSLIGVSAVFSIIFYKRK